MQEIKQLLENYLAGKVDSENFVIQYLSLARLLRDETQAALDKFPGLSDQLSGLFVKRFEGLISQQEYDEKWHQLTSQLGEIRVKPGSKEDEILSHLFVEADAYREDPESRDEGLHIGNIELKEEVVKALQMLE
jgi:hypothetical protein